MVPGLLLAHLCWWYRPGHRSGCTGLRGMCGCQQMRQVFLNNSTAHQTGSREPGLLERAFLTSCSLWWLRPSAFLGLSPTPMCTPSVFVCTPCLGCGAHLPSLWPDSRLPSGQRRALGPTLEGGACDTRNMRMETWLGAAGCGDPGTLCRNSLPGQPRRKADRALHREGGAKAF